MDERTKQILVLGREHYAKREFDKAEPLLREALEHEDRFADIHDMLGVIAHSRGNFIAAEKHFERALAINPAYTEAALNLAVTYNDRGKYEKAREVYSRIQGSPSGLKSGLDPFARGKIANMHADVGQAYADAGLPLEAILELEKAVELCPHFADLRTKLGSLLREVNEVGRAKEQYEAAIATRPNFVLARLQLGVTLLSMGDPDGAAVQWNKVIGIDPDNSRAKMYLRMLSLQKMKTAPPGRARLDASASGTRVNVSGAEPPNTKPGDTKPGDTKAGDTKPGSGPNARARIHAAAKTAWGRLRGGELTPFRAAASVAVGLAVGVTPLYGLHLWIVVAICLPLRLDAALAYLAANISLPFVAPFLLLAEVELGSLARTGHALDLTASEARARAFGELLKEVVVGTLIFSPAMAVVGGALTWGIAASAARRRKNATPFDAAVERVAARYARGRRAAYHYVRGKLASDPVAARIVALGDRGGLGDVVDVGCGRGQLAVLLLEAGNATQATGFDWDATKVGDAQEAATGLAATFRAGDMREVVVPPCDTALFVDVLHYLTDEEQDAVLARAADAARVRVIVRELDPDRGWRSGVTRLQERVTTSLGYNRGARVNVRPIEKLAATLRARSFDVRVEPCWGATPFSNVLVVAERAARA